MFIIRTNSTCSNEKEYIFEQILGLFLGVPFLVRYTEDSDGISIEKEGEKGTIEIEDVFFDQFGKGISWLSEESLPKLPLQINTEDGLPIIYGNGKIEKQRDQVKIGLDIFGSCFFMLSRYEEVISTKRDAHGRFPANESLAFKEGFLTRPIVDDYVNLLWNQIQHLWPGATKKEHFFRANISCDVDNLLDKGVRFPGIIKRLAGDILHRKSIKQFWTSIYQFYKVSILQNLKHDPFNTFDFMMDVCESNGLKAAFYFIPKNNKLPIDGDYDIESEDVLVLMKRIISRGHEIGYHASYGSYMDVATTKAEVELLRQVYQKAGGDPKDIKGGRQHYLRWEPGVTELNWEAAGLKYDATLGYAEHVGFRCGTARDFKLYNVPNRKELALSERPLILMEGSLLLKKYQNLNYKEAETVANNLKEKCLRQSSNFNVLWHNSFFREPELFSLFKRICKI